MTRKSDSNNVFLKFEMSPELRRDFKDACTYWQVSMKDMIAEMAEAVIEATKKDMGIQKPDD